MILNSKNSQQCRADKNNKEHCQGVQCSDTWLSMSYSCTRMSFVVCTVTPWIPIKPSLWISLEMCLENQSLESRIPYKIWNDEKETVRSLSRCGVSVWHYSATQASCGRGGASERTWPFSYVEPKGESPSGLSCFQGNGLSLFTCECENIEHFMAYLLHCSVYLLQFRAILTFGLILTENRTADKLFLKTPRNLALCTFVPKWAILLGWFSVSLSLYTGCPVGCVSVSVDILSIPH